MVYLFFNVIVTSFSLIIIRDKNAFFNYSARIEALSVVFPAFMLNLARAVDKFFTILSASAKSLF
jgi:hypothetical protein